MTTHLTLNGATRAETDEAVIATLLRKGWQVTEPPVVETTPATLTAEDIASQHFSAYQIAALQRLEMALAQAGQPLGPAMTACKSWLEGVMLTWAADATPRTAEMWGQPQATFEQASAEAVASLQQ
jgi:hypothetical protein